MPWKVKRHADMPVLAKDLLFAPLADRFQMPSPAKRQRQHRQDSEHRQRSSARPRRVGAYLRDILRCLAEGEDNLVPSRSWITCQAVAGSVWAS